MHTRTRVLPIICALGLAMPLAWPSRAEARRRGASGARVVVAAGYYRPYYAYRPYLYEPFYGRYWGSFWGPYPFWYPGGVIYDRSGGARILVTPNDAEVFVDGYFVGVADDFDGVFQRLELPPGGHEIQVYRDGYRSVSDRVFFRPGVTVKLRHELTRLAPGESPDPRPVPSAAPAGSRRPEGPPPGREPMPTAGRDGWGRRAGGATGGAMLSLRVQPAGAEIFIDGERWRAAEGDEPLDVQVPEGMHRVEVRKDGYQTFATEVRVHAGETTTVNVSLPSRERP